tara:strand:- start:3731 stop:4429 length:699 start_codon:yes stop_codon:yes gene_type:complete
MSDFPRIQDQTITVAAGETANVNITGELLAIISASAEFDLSFNGGAYFTTQSGLSYFGKPDPATGERPRFQSISVKNNSGAPNIIRVQASTGEILDNRAVFGVGSVPVITNVGEAVEVKPKVGEIWSFTNSDLQLKKATSAEAINRNATVSVAAGNYAGLIAAVGVGVRASVVLEHIGTETMWLHSQGSFSAGKNGVMLRPGERYEAEIFGALYASNHSAFAQSIVVSEKVW